MCRVLCQPKLYRIQATGEAYEYNDRNTTIAEVMSGGGVLIIVRNEDDEQDDDGEGPDEGNEEQDGERRANHSKY